MSRCVLMFIILKVAKEKVKEQEELPERPGQTECKVSKIMMFREVLYNSFLRMSQNPVEFLRFISSLCVYQMFLFYKYVFLVTSVFFSSPCIPVFFYLVLSNFHGGLTTVSSYHKY